MLVKTEAGHGPINSKSAARKAQGLPTTLQQQHAWVTSNDCTIYLSGAQHPQCHCCPKLAFRTGPHATLDCPLRYWDVFDTCPSFLRDGSRDPDQWHIENLTRAANSAKDAWVRVQLIRQEDLMLPHY